MGGAWWYIPTLLAGAAVFVLLVWHPLRRALRQKELDRLRKEFHQQREHLEAHFLKRAGATGKPRGLSWVNCDFANDVVYARDKKSGEISAFVGVTIHFEAIDGGGMEEIEFVTAPRDATAVFRVAGGKWTTEGRALMNLNPTEALRHFQRELELVSHELARTL